MCVCAHVCVVVGFMTRFEGYGSVSGVHPQQGRSVSIGTCSKSQASKGSSEGQLRYLIVHVNRMCHGMC